MEVTASLNPCCNGIYSMRVESELSTTIEGLNPCCNGIYSMRKTNSTLSRMKN